MRKSTSAITPKDMIFYKAFYSQHKAERQENFLTLQIVMYIVMAGLQVSALMFRLRNQEKYAEKEIICLFLFTAPIMIGACIDYLACAEYIQRHEKVVEKRLIAPTIVWFFRHISVIIAILTFDNVEKIMGFAIITMMPNIAFRIIPVFIVSSIYYCVREFIITPYYAIRNSIAQMGNEPVEAQKEE